VDTIRISWPKGAVLFDEIKNFKHDDWNLDKNGFYALLSGSWDNPEKSWKNLKLLYIGQAFDQTLRERIIQDHPAYKCVRDYQKEHSVDIIVKIGFIKESTAERLTQQLYDDVECCLIFCNQPLCNTTCKDSYAGRDLQVLNEGDPAGIKDSCVCSKTNK